MDAGRGQLAHRHLKSTITDDCNHCFFWAPKLCANCCGETKTHGPSATGSEPVIWLQSLAELCGPHLVLTDVGCNNGAALRHGVQLIQNVLHLEAALLLVLQRIFFLIT